MSKQLGFNWTFLQRKAWIEQAEIDAGTGKDGTGVSVGRMRDLLHKINEHLGDKAEAWPSQERLAEMMGVSKRTVIRAAQALESQSLLIVIDNPSPGGWSYNSYRIVWAELQLLEPSRREAWQSILRSEPGDVTTEPGDVTTEPGDVTTEPGDVTSPKQLTNNPKNNSKNKPPQQQRPTSARRTARAAEVSGEWLVVASVLKNAGMSDYVGAITAAKRRELTPDEVLDYVKRLERLQAREPRATVGWLYRWITGKSSVPDECEPETAPRQVSTLSSDEQRRLDLELIRARCIKAGRRAGFNDVEIDLEIDRILTERGFEPGSITVNSNQPQGETIGR